MQMAKPADPSPAVLIENSAGVAEKISAMPALPNPPAVTGAMVPVVQPGDSTNYQSPISTLLTTAPGEELDITAGAGAGLYLVGGNEVSVSTVAGNASLAAANASTGNTPGGHASVQAGWGSGTGAGGVASLTAGDAKDGVATGGNATVAAGKGGFSGGDGGAVILVPGSPQGANGNGGSLVIQLPSGAGSGMIGLIKIANIGTVDPHVATALWADPASGYVLKVSQG